MDPLTISALISAGASLGGAALSKKQKAPQIPHVTLPGPGDYFDYPAIQGEANRLLSQPGFGPNFEDKAGSPIAQGMRRRAEQQVYPQISNQFSSRGLGQSNLAANKQIQARQDTESDVNSLFAQLFQLNEIQKSNQATAGLGAKERMMGRAIERQTGQAAIDMGLPQQQFALDQAANQQTNLNRAGGSELGLGLAGLFSGGQQNNIAQMLGQFGFGQKPATVKAGLLETSDDELQELLYSLQNQR